MERAPQQNEIERLAYDPNEAALFSHLDAQFQRRKNEALYGVDNQANVLLNELNEQHGLYGQRAWLTGMFYTFGSDDSEPDQSALCVEDASIILGDFMMMATDIDGSIDAHYIWQSVVMPTEKGYLQGYIDAEAIYNTQHEKTAQHVELTVKSPEYYAEVLETVAPGVTYHIQSVVDGEIVDNHIATLANVREQIVPLLPTQPRQVGDIAAEALAGYLSHVIPGMDSTCVEYKMCGEYQLADTGRHAAYTKRSMNAQAQRVYNPCVFVDNQDGGYVMGVEGEMEYCSYILRLRAPLDTLASNMRIDGEVRHDEI